MPQKPNETFMNSSTGPFDQPTTIDNQLEQFARASISQISKKGLQIPLDSQQVDLRGSYKISDRVKNQSSLDSLPESSQIDQKGHNITFYQKHGTKKLVMGPESIVMSSQIDSDGRTPIIYSGLPG